MSTPIDRTWFTLPVKRKAFSPAVDLFNPLRDERDKKPRRRAASPSPSPNQAGAGAARAALADALRRCGYMTEAEKQVLCECLVTSTPDVLTARQIARVREMLAESNALAKRVAAHAEERKDVVNRLWALVRRTPEQTRAVDAALPPPHASLPESVFQCLLCADAADADGREWLADVEAVTGRPAVRHRATPLWNLYTSPSADGTPAYYFVVNADGIDAARPVFDDASPFAEVEEDLASRVAPADPAVAAAAGQCAREWLALLRAGVDAAPAVPLAPDREPAAPGAAASVSPGATLTISPESHPDSPPLSPMSAADGPHGRQSASTASASATLSEATASSLSQSDDELYTPRAARIHIQVSGHGRAGAVAVYAAVLIYGTDTVGDDGAAQVDMRIGAVNAFGPPRVFRRVPLDEALGTGAGTMESGDATVLSVLSASTPQGRPRKARSRSRVKRGKEKDGTLCADGALLKQFFPKSVTVFVNGFDATVFRSVNPRLREDHAIDAPQAFNVPYTPIEDEFPMLHLGGSDADGGIRRLTPAERLALFNSTGALRKQRSTAADDGALLAYVRGVVDALGAVSGYDRGLHVRKAGMAAAAQAHPQGAPSAVGDDAWLAALEAVMYGAGETSPPGAGGAASPHSVRGSAMASGASEWSMSDGGGAPIAGMSTVVVSGQRVTHRFLDLLRTVFLRFAADGGDTRLSYTSTVAAARGGGVLMGPGALMPPGGFERLLKATDKFVPLEVFAELFHGACDVLAGTVTHFHATLTGGGSPPAAWTPGSTFDTTGSSANTGHAAVRPAGGEAEGIDYATFVEYVFKECEEGDVAWVERVVRLAGQARPTRRGKGAPAEAAPQRHVVAKAVCSPDGELCSEASFLAESLFAYHAPVTCVLPNLLHEAYTGHPTTRHTHPHEFETSADFAEYFARLCLADKAFAMGVLWRSGGAMGNAVLWRRVPVPTANRPPWPVRQEAAASQTPLPAATDGATEASVPSYSDDAWEAEGGSDGASRREGSTSFSVYSSDALRRGAPPPEVGVVPAPLAMSPWVVDRTYRDAAGRPRTVLHRRVLATLLDLQRATYLLVKAVAEWRGRLPRPFPFPTEGGAGGAGCNVLLDALLDAVGLTARLQRDLPVCLDESPLCSHLDTLYRLVGVRKPRRAMIDPLAPHADDLKWADAYIRSEYLSHLHMAREAVEIARDGACVLKFSVRRAVGGGADAHAGVFRPSRTDSPIPKTTSTAARTRRLPRPAASAPAFRKPLAATGGGRSPSAGSPFARTPLSAPRVAPQGHGAAKIGAWDAQALAEHGVYRMKSGRLRGEWLVAAERALQEVEALRPLFWVDPYAPRDGRGVSPGMTARERAQTTYGAEMRLTPHQQTIFALRLKHEQRDAATRLLRKYTLAVLERYYTALVAGTTGKNRFIRWRAGRAERLHHAHCVLLQARYYDILQAFPLRQRQARNAARVAALISRSETAHLRLRFTALQSFKRPPPPPPERHLEPAPDCGLELALIECALKPTRAGPVSAVRRRAAALVYPSLQLLCEALASTTTEGRGGAETPPAAPLPESLETPPPPPPPTEPPSTVPPTEPLQTPQPQTETLTDTPTMPSLSLSLSEVLQLAGGPEHCPHLSKVCAAADADPPPHPPSALSVLCDVLPAGCALELLFFLV